MISENLPIERLELLWVLWSLGLANFSMWYYSLICKQKKEIAFTLKVFQSTGGKRSQSPNWNLILDNKTERKKDGGMEGFKKKP